MKVEAFDENGKPVINQQGELVCTAPFPSMPIYFWDDPDGEKYHAAYFDVYPNVWRHGDFIEINDRGGVVIYGRSDATLNPGGVRIGTAEIYRQVEQLEEIEDSLVVGQDWKNDVRVILFVKMAEGQDLTDDLRNKIKNDYPDQCLSTACACQDPCRAGNSLYPEHEKSGTGRQKGHSEPAGAQQGCPEKPGVAGFFCGLKGTPGRLIQKM